MVQEPKERSHSPCRLSAILIVIGVVVVVSSSAVQLVFQSDKTPCSETGIGCHDVWELIGDTWPSLVATFGYLIGVVLFAYGFYGLLLDKKR